VIAASSLTISSRDSFSTRSETSSIYDLTVGSAHTEQGLSLSSYEDSFGNQGETLATDSVVNQTGQVWTLTLSNSEVTGSENMEVTVDGDGTSDFTSQQHSLKVTEDPANGPAQTTEHDWANYSDTGSSSETTVVTYDDSSSDNGSWFTVNFDIELTDDHDYERGGTYDKLVEPDGTVTLSDDAAQAVTQAKASTFTLAVSGGFSDGDTSGTFDMSATDESHSTTDDTQATHNGRLTVHDYHEASSLEGAMSMALAASGSDFSFSYAMTTDRHMTRTRDGTLTSERDSFSDHHVDHTVTSISYVDGDGQTQTSSGTYDAQYSSAHDLTRTFDEPEASATGPNRQATGVTIVTCCRRCAARAQSDDSRGN